MLPFDQQLAAVLQVSSLVGYHFAHSDIITKVAYQKFLHIVM